MQCEKQSSQAHCDLDYAAIVDEDGCEIPITSEMIDQLYRRLLGPVDVSSRLSLKTVQGERSLAR